MGNDMLVGMGLIIGGLIASCYGLCPATSRNSLRRLPLRTGVWNATQSSKIESAANVRNGSKANKASWVENH